MEILIYNCTPGMYAYTSIPVFHKFDDLPVNISKEGFQVHRLDAMYE